ncbi:MAG: MFS transporter [Candidatus Komeilibacteria bacterium]
MKKNLISLFKQRLFQKPAWKQGVFILVLALLISIVMPLAAHADTEGFLAGIFTTIVGFIISIIGGLITLVLAVLINVAQFNDFINAPAVVIGWVLVRDICNMFFIVSMLLISVGTVLGIQSFHYKNYLKKIIIMAILVNFSRTICGLLIDVSQIVMLTFISAADKAMAVGFVEAFGINKLTSLATHVNEAGQVDTDGMGVLFAGVFAIIAATILLLVLLSVVVMLAYRIVMLWVLVVFSPVYFALQAIPKADSKAGIWWSKFSEQLVAGPVVAFFIWLTLSVVSQNNGSFIAPNKNDVDPGLIGSQVSNAPYILNYILGISMLLIGLTAAKTMGGAAGALAGKTFSKAKGMGWKGIKGGYKGVKSGVSFVKDKALYSKKTKKEMENKIQSKGGLLGTGGLLGMQGLRNARKLDKLSSREKARTASGGKVLKKLGLDGEKTIGVLYDKQKDKEKRAKDKFYSSSDQQALASAQSEWAANGKPRTDFEEKLKRQQVNAPQKAREAFVDSFIKGQDPSAIGPEREKLKKEAEKNWNNMSSNDQQNEIKAYENVNWQKEQLDPVVAEQAYLDSKKKESRKQTTYQPNWGRRISPMSPIYGFVKKQSENLERADRTREAIIQDPSTFAASQVVDEIKDVKGGATKRIIGKMTQPELEVLANHLKTELNASGLTPEQRKKKQANFDAFWKTVRHTSEESPDSAADKFYQAADTNSIMIKQGADGGFKSITEAAVKKSNKDFLTDISEEKVGNTNLELQNEILNLKPSDAVKMKDNSTGWHINRDKTDLNADQITVSNGVEERVINQDEFMSQNSDMVAEHFYNSDRYQKMISVQGKDHVMNKEEFDTARRIGESSQEGVTYRAGNKTAAIKVSALEEKVGDITGEQDRAGIHVIGSEALKVAGGMKEMIAEQKEALQTADTEDKVREVLQSHFGRMTEATGEELEKIKQTSLTNAEASIASLDTSNIDNAERIKKDGFSLIDKNRVGYGAKYVLRHEDTHATLDYVDQDGSLRGKVWDQLGLERQKEARQYVATTRGEGLTEREIQTEYLVDALQNVNRPGGPDHDKPQLPAELANLLSGDKTVSGNIRVEHQHHHNVGEMAARYQTWQAEEKQTGQQASSGGGNELMTDDKSSQPVVSTKPASRPVTNEAQGLLSSGWNGGAIMNNQQFILFRKWLENVLNNQADNISRKQLLLGEELTEKMIKLNSAVKNMDLEGDNVDLSLVLQENDLDEGEIKDIVEQYSEEENE